VNRSAGTFALVTLLTVAFTAMVPVSCGGVTMVHVVVDVQLTVVAFAGAAAPSSDTAA
jgi:hypothetical protein